ncbi:MAG TPA: hypothetical protein VF202_14115 [Trueperaceae bacterium]
MIARLRPIAVVAALFVLVGAPALAQEDSVLQRYDLAVENLEFAIASVPGDPVQARDELERAVNALLTLSRDTTSATLLEAMQRTFDRARTAVDNESRADLAVQAAVLRGGFRRLVADSAFTAGAAGELDTALSRLTHVAEELGFAADDLETLAGAGTSLAALRLAFEAGAAAAIAAELTVSERLLPTDREAAYEALATAYGDSLLVQDSPRADPDLHAALLRAAQALVQNDAEAFADATDEAEGHLTRLASAARAGEAGGLAAPAAPPEGAAPDAAGAAPGAGEAPAPAAQDEAPAAPPAEGAPAPADQQADQAAPQGGQPDAAEPPSDEAAAPPAAPAAAGPEGQPGAGEAAGRPGEGLGELPSLGGEPAAEGAAPVDLALLRAQFEQERRDAELAALVQELEGAGLPAGLARSQASALLDAGFTSTDAAFDAVAARLGEAVADLRAGDAAGAASAVGTARMAFENVRGLVGARDSAAAADAAALFDSVLDRPAMREHDLTLLAASVEAGRAALLGEPAAGAGLSLERSVDAVWGGWTRLAVLFVLGVLAFVPLRYLNLAFGGGNANWRLVAWALFLLLVPVFYEALAALGTAVARLTETPSLDVLARWSMFDSTLGHVVWAALVFLALLFAAIGLRGICAQFGVLGARGGPQASTTPTLVESSGVRQQTAVDWDDEF